MNGVDYAVYFFSVTLVRNTIPTATLTDTLRDRSRFLGGKSPCRRKNQSEMRKLDIMRLSLPLEQKAPQQKVIVWQPIGVVAR